MSDQFPEPDDNEPIDIFDDFDLNDDSEHSTTEFANVWTDLCNEACYENGEATNQCICQGINYEDVLAAYDDSGDGVIDFSEFDIFYWDF